MHSRQLEQIVALFEQALSHHRGVSIESPAFLPDRDTGKPREVDVLISGQLGSVAIRCIVECRAHQRPQGVQWLEQVSAKKQSVDASEAVAVSASGFTKNALEKAPKLGIMTRTISELTAEGIQSLFGTRRIIGVQRRAKFENVVFNVVSFETGLPSMAPPAFDSKIVRDATGVQYSLFELLDSEWSDYEGVLTDAQLDSNGRARATAMVVLPEEEFTFIGQSNRHYLKGIVVRMEIYELQVDARFRYGQIYELGDKTAYRVGYDFGFPHADVCMEVFGEALPPGKG